MSRKGKLPWMDPGENTPVRDHGPWLTMGAPEPTAKPEAHRSLDGMLHPVQTSVKKARCQSLYRLSLGSSILHRPLEVDAKGPGGPKGPVRVA